MQAAAASWDLAKLEGLPLLVLLELVLLGLLEPPHAASASAELNAASAIGRHRRRWPACRVLARARRSCGRLIGVVGSGRFMSETSLELSSVVLVK